MKLIKNQDSSCKDQRLDKDFDPPKFNLNSVIGALSLSLFLTFISPVNAQENTDDNFKLSSNNYWDEDSFIKRKDILEFAPSNTNHGVSPMSRPGANNKPNGNNQIYGTKELIFISNRNIISSLGQILPSDRMENMMLSCYKHYDFIDGIAKNLDFPTILILATFYIESSCELNNYDRHGVFQLFSSKKRYSLGKLSKPKFKEQIVDAVKYFREKYALYKAVSGKEITLTYENYDINNIMLHGVMFNGWPKGITPETSKYNVCNISERHQCKKDGILAAIARLAKIVNEKKYGGLEVAYVIK